MMVKDFEDPEIDHQLTGLNAREIRFGSENLGHTMAVGVRACRGEVICFLDDDDQFDPRKLSVVRAEFQRDRDLGYYHNGLSLVDETGRPMDGEDPTVGSRALAMSRDWDFCDSCISVRRELVLPLLDRWPEVPKAADSFLDYVSRASRYSRSRTLEPLTRYRVHPRSSSRRTDHAPSYLSTARILRSLPPSEARNAAISSLLGRYFSAAVRGRSKDRRGALRALVYLVATAAPSHFRPDAREVVCGVLIPFSPRTAQRLYARWRKGAVDWLRTASPGGPARAGPSAEPEPFSARHGTGPDSTERARAPSVGPSTPYPQEQFDEVAFEARGAR